MHVHADPVAGAVHVELKVTAIGDHVLHRTHLVFVEQAHVQQALGQHADTGLVRVGEARPGSGGRHCRLLRGQNQLVQRALRAGEGAVGGEGAGDVAGIAVQLAARVDQYQFTVTDRRGVGPVVQHAGVGPGGHDRAVGRVLRAVLAKLVQQLGVQVKLAHVLPDAQHGG